MKTIHILLLAALLLVTACAGTPERSSTVFPPFHRWSPDGTDMGCRALAVYFAAHETVNELGIDPDAPGPVAVEMYNQLYEMYRATRLDDTDQCPCLLRRMVTEKESNGMDVPDYLDIGPIG